MENTGNSEPLEDREDLSRSSIEDRIHKTDDLLARNISDDKRQTRSYLRQDRAEIRQEHTDSSLYVVNKLVLDSLERLEDKTSQIGERVDGLHVRMDSLVDTTNHRLALFTTAIGTTLKEEELLSSLGVQLANHKVVRWGLGVLAVAIAGTATYEHWRGAVTEFFKRFT